MSGIRALHFTLYEWLNLVDKGSAQLPEFQRDFVWKNNKVVAFLNAILQNRPVGCLLLVKIKDHDTLPLNPRPVEGAGGSSESAIQYLILDGQQRITALWRALRASNADGPYFVSYKEGDDASLGTVSTLPKRKWQENPKLCLERGWVPIRLLGHHPASSEIDPVSDWVDTALADEGGRVLAKRQRALEKWISRHSEQLRTFEIPYLPMPESTTEDQAIETFVQINTSASKLRDFDIASAEALMSEEAHLRELREQAWVDVRGLRRYLGRPSVGDLLLKVACLRSGFAPVQSHYRRSEVVADIAENFEDITNGLQWAVDLLYEDRIWDSRRLPSVVPLRVLPALFARLPKSTAKQAKARKVARAYIWRSFLTERYKSAAATLLKGDHDALCRVFRGETDVDSVPIWRLKVPGPTEIEEASWPTRSSLPRALLAVALRRGSRDIGTGTELRPEDVGQREYHHLFPRAYLERHVERGRINPHLAMNCILISGKTNREAADKAPIKYLAGLAMETSGTSVTERDMRLRLRSHVVRIHDIQVRGGVEKSYRKFIRERAALVHEDVESLVDGDDP